MKQKHFHKGIKQLVQEGAIQLYKTVNMEEYLLGAVGQLQFEVFEHRMKNEYNVDVVMEHQGSKIARWVENEELMKIFQVHEVFLLQIAMINKSSCLKMILLLDGSKIKIQRSYLRIQWIQNNNKGNNNLKSPVFRTFCYSNYMVMVDFYLINELGPVELIVW